ncbi:MAG: cytochrome c oxidase subunit II [Deltaproteobacteria bacterium]|nr:cytochrome c oxidase subunit II [Deltaproteobacteria bacterium]MDQ3295572.1 cytochrome c oxidase subunit II [Myxococcota bacterium]
MKSFARFSMMIGLTSAVTIAICVALFGTPSADAQPTSAEPQTATQPAQADVPAGTQPPVVQQPDPNTPGSPAGGKAADPAKNQATTSTNPGGPANPNVSPPPAAGATQRTWYEELAYRPIQEEGTFWMPKSVNIVADDSDSMFYATLGLSAFFFIAIAGAVIYLVIKYRHRPGHKPEPSAGHNDALEITWTVIPTIICVFLFYYGWRTYVQVVTPPNKAVEVNLLAKRWTWNFTHSNGVEDSDLHVPVNKPVRVVMTSTDVLHAFYAPVMRVKQDIIPRRYTYVWFHATKPGTYRLTCAEYCGTDHSQMGMTQDGRRAVVVVHQEGDYERYLADKQALEGGGDPIDHGKRLYEKKGCVTCHSIDGSARIGPSFKGVFGKPQAMADGSKVVADENYLRESLMVPNAKTRAGFPAGTMPAFEGQLKERDIEGIIAFIKSLE